MWLVYKKKLEEQIIKIENLLMIESKEDLVELGACVLSMLELIVQMEQIKDEKLRQDFWDKISKDVEGVATLTEKYLQQNP